ncbi:MAG: DUF2064 domain-containing protein [Frankiaceae bacterium]
MISRRAREPHLVVLAKTPLAGRVKTRLCPPLSPGEAAMVAAAALADTLEAVAATPALTRTLVLDGPRWSGIPAGFRVVTQASGTHAERIAAAFPVGAGPALLLGMDTPQLTLELLAAATRCLLADGTDAVLGPAYDGGWWALGMRTPNPALIRGVPTSTALTGQLQEAALVHAGWRVRRLPTLRDVDTAADAFAVARDCPSGRFAAAVAAAFGPGAWKPALT